MKIIRKHTGTFENEERVEAKEHTLLVYKAADERRWIKYFEGLLNGDENREAVIVAFLEVMGKIY